MPGTADPYGAFRLNLEQQRKRAKDLLRDARAGDAAAARRLADVLGARTPDPAALKLADAQFAVARELGFASWPALRAHVRAQDAARAALAEPGPAIDADMPTLHIRCGTDIKGELEAARFGGGFLSLWDTFPVGPVTSGPDWIAQRARFHADAGTAPDVDYDGFLAELTAADMELAASAGRYERVVIWTEHDSHDQLSLVRCLAHYARSGPPRVLELISVNHFPGSRRFIGLGQLPPEAMRLLWERRERIDAGRLSLGAETWSALTAPDPRALALLARSGTPVLPHLAPAVLRHLRELPSSRTGLGLTQLLILEALSRGPATMNDLWRIVQGELEPLPFLGDLMFLQIVNSLGGVIPTPFERATVDPQRPFRDRLTMTQTGYDVLRGATDWLSLRPAIRWVGGVRVDPSEPAWRWDEAGGDVRLM